MAISAADKLTCSECHREVREEDQFCPNCGS
ncbi:MAG: zinc-ribbon domain-containing protein, partial [Ignavibacteria bacterium]|nr:zinc-ribbon domain-containing protein [Ignavibacteria bacterium]